MWRAIRKLWRYAGTALGVLHDRHASPEIQLEQAIEEARAQHRRLSEQAANVIANQQQVQRRLDRTVVELERADASARQGLLLADREDRLGDSARASALLATAESCAERSLALEHDVRDLEQQVLDATRAAQSAKSAVVANAEALRKHLAQREKLLSTLDQARMQDQLNNAMRQFDAAVGDTVPTLDEVSRKIDARLDRARARAELAAAQTPEIDLHMAEIERAQRSMVAQARLAEMRVSLGLGQAIEVRCTERKELPR